MTIYENTSDMSCEECGASFKVEHDMGVKYIPQHCVFCGNEILPREERIDYDEERTLN